jgi:superfamily II DNA or RNA helicase
MITLRPYQETSVNEIRTALAKYRRVLFQLPTAGGKTIIFSYIAQASAKYNRKVLILSSRTEILQQNGGALERIGIDVAYINPKARKVPEARVCCGMAQTLRRRVEKEDWQEFLKTVELVIIDECHETVSDFVHEFLAPKCFVLGVTGTPRRYGNMGQLGSLYKAMVIGVSVKELEDLGYLSTATHYSIACPKLEDIPIDGGVGDFRQKLLAQAYENKMMYTGVVSEYMRLCPNTKALCFCVSAKQAIEVTKEFLLNGIEARYLLSGSFDSDEMYSGERSDVIDDFKANKFKILVNVGIAVAGFDCPDIETVILNFATVSMTKYRQAIGRGARITETKKHFTILDCGSNYRRLGMYDEPVTWSLWHSTSVGDGVLTLKECDPKQRDINGKLGCGQMIPMQCKVCPNCGYVFPTDDHLYQMRLEEVAAKGSANASPLSVEEFVAQKKLEGWKTPRIMIQVCLANPKQDKEAFMRASKVLEIENPAGYWYFFKKQWWTDMKKKIDRSAAPKLF